MKRLCRFFPLLLLFAPLAFAQGYQQTVQFKVMLVWANGHNFSDKQDVEGMPGVQGNNRDSAGQPIRGNAVSNMAIRIAVLNDMGQTIAETSPSSEGYATFTVVGSVRNAQGLTQDVSYRVRVYGASIEEENVENVVPAEGDRILTVRIHRKGENNAKAPGGIVSTTSLKIPKKAEKEVDRGSKDFDDKKYQEARDHFQKAIDIYPSYDEAYNGLGATLVEMGDIGGAQKAFETSIQVNDKYAPGYRNLAQIAASNKDFAKAASLLERSLALEPMNVEALSRLAQFDYILGKDTAVPELVRRMHSLPHPGQALAHFAAAASLERMMKPDEAIGEYTLFIKEASPENTLISAAKAAIARCREKLNEPTTQ
ncbi:MAG: tetratricopeptide repeat protein [Terriglobia bacterium]|jgi:Flp pilus assembly protein TadD|nr:tetratricopeptide repeat protein [Terriglobia bacterium]